MGLNYQAAVNISANFTGAGAVNTAKQSLKSLDSSTAGIRQTFDNATTAVKAFVAAAAVREVVQYAKSIIDLGDELNDLKQKTGIGVQALASLKAAAEDSGLEFKGLETGLKKFSVGLSAAEAGNKQALTAFKAAKVEIRDLNGVVKPTGDLVLELADRFASMTDGPEKAAIAVKLFGKAGTDMIPLLNAGSDAIKNFGLQISDDFAERADQFNDTLNQLKRNTQQFGVDGVGALLPTLQEVANAFVEISKSTGDTKTGFLVLGEVIRQLSVVLIPLIELVVELVDTVYIAAKTIVKTFVEVVKQIGLTTVAIDAARLAFVGDFSGASAKLNDYAKLANASSQEFFRNASKDGDDYLNRLINRAKSTAGVVANLERNSLFGNGTAGSLADTQPKPRKKASGSFDAIDTKEESRREKELEQIQKFKITQAEANDIRLLELDRINLSEVAFNKLKDARKLEGEAAKASVGFTNEGKAAFALAAEQAIKTKEAIDDLAEAQRTSFGAGAQGFFKDYMEAASATAAQTKRVFVTAFSGIEDAIVDFVKTGELSFSKLADAVVADLVRIAVQKSISFALSAGVSALGSLAGGVSSGFSAGDSFNPDVAYAANGGIIGSSGHMPLAKYANGGVANSPQLAVFGEGSRPEAFVPLPDGRSIPVALRGAGGGGAGGSSVQVNVYMGGEGGGATTEANGQGSDATQSKQLGKMIAAAVVAEITNQKRPGGILA